VEREYFEIDLSIGETLQIGEILVTVVDSETAGLTVLVERLPGDQAYDDDGFGYDCEESASRSMPR